MYRVFFDLHPYSRGRHVDAFRNLPEGFSGVAPNGWVECQEGSSKRKPSFKGKLAKFIPFLLKEKDVSVDGDLAYMFGSFLKNPKVPYFIEVDNPACLTYYSPLSLSNPFIKKRILNYVSDQHFSSFLAMSEASKKGMVNAFGEQVTDRIDVVYPPFPYDFSSPDNSDRISFVFVSYNFWIKGGRELLYAFNRVKGDLTLTMVSNVPESFKSRFRGRVSFFGRMPRLKLLNLMSEMDAIVHPTYMDSFGIAPYEAVHMGLAAISTDMYALPEFIRHEKNGFIFPSPIAYFNRSNLPNLKFWLFGVENYVKSRSFPEVVKYLTDYMQYYVDNPSELKKHKRESRRLSSTVFSLEERNKKLKKLFMDAVS